MKKIFAFIAVALMALPVRAASFGSSARGTTSGEFLQLGVGARAVSMGEAYAAVADEATALYWNPAAMTNVEKHSASFMHAPYLENSYYDYASYCQNLNDRGAFGVGVQYFTAGTLTQTDETTGANIGNFSPYDLAATLGYAYKFKDTRIMSGFSVGIAGKFIQSKILDLTAKTGSVDAGILSPGYFNNRLKLAFTATNIGGKLKYDQKSENLPLTFRIGSSYKIYDRWLASLDGGFPKNDNPFFAVGTEYQLMNKGPWRLAGRGGYNSQTLGSVDGFTGATIGMGLGYNGLSFDYGFAPMGGVGLTHRVSITFNF